MLSFDFNMQISLFDIHPTFSSSLSSFYRTFDVFAAEYIIIKNLKKLRINAEMLYMQFTWPERKVTENQSGKERVNQIRLLIEVRASFLMKREREKESGGWTI